MQTGSTPSRLMSVRARWQLFGLMAVVIARSLVRLERLGVGEAWAKADALELWVRGAVHLLNREIAEASAAGEPDDPEAAGELAHMRAIAVALLALAMFLQSLKEQLPRKGAGRYAYRASAFAIAAASLPASPIQGASYLDSS